MKRALLTLIISICLTGAVAVAAPALSSDPYVPAPVEFELAPSATAQEEVRGELLSRPLDPPKRFDMVGLRWQRGDPETDVELRVRQEGEPWSDWTEATQEADHAPDPRRGEPASQRISAPVWADGADEVQYRTSERLDGVTLEFINTTGTATPADRAETVVRKAANRGVVGMANLFTAAGDAPRPSMVSRSEWGANRYCRPRSSPEYGTVKMVFVHHTANARAYSRSDAPAMVLASCRYHRYTRGWDDIGYNFLVDKYGRLYEGRAGGAHRAVVGAQAQGWNAQSAGISNLGDYSSREQSRDALVAMDRLISWKLDNHDVPRGGTTVLTSAGGGTNRYRPGTRVRFNRISGHRDGNNTACPGSALYSQLPRLRRGVESHAGEADDQVVDNSDRSRFEASANWSTSTRRSAAKWGSDFRYAGPTAASDPASFKLRAPRAGRYAIYFRHPEHPEYSSSARVGFKRKGQAPAFQSFDLRRNGGRWILLGEYRIAAGEETRVVMSRWTSARGWLVADAVRMVRR